MQCGLEGVHDLSSKNFYGGAKGPIVGVVRNDRCRKEAVYPSGCDWSGWWNLCQVTDSIHNSEFVGRNKRKTIRFVRAPCGFDFAAMMNVNSFSYLSLRRIPWSCFYVHFQSSVKGVSSTCYSSSLVIRPSITIILSEKMEMALHILRLRVSLYLAEDTPVEAWYAFFR